MFGQIYLISCLVMMTTCWRIDVSEKNVAMQLSLNVTLDCTNHDDNDDNSLKLAQVTQLRILKRDPNNHWVSLAKVTQNSSRVETSLQNVMLAGNASNRSNSFLKLQFPFATDYVIGEFVCEVEGHYNRRDEEGDKVLKRVVKTNPVVITQRDPTYQDIMKVINQFQQKDETKNLNEHILFVLLQKMINLRNEDFEKMTNIHNIDLEEVNDRTNKLIDLYKEIMRYVMSIVIANPSQVWPTGTYSILQPKTGCPYSSTFDWKYSSARLITKPGSSNNDKLSSSSHLSPDTLQHDRATNRHYAFIILCSKTVAVEGPAWPKGSYCIQKYDKGSCPSGLTAGNIEVGKYDDDKSSRYVTVNHPSSYEHPTYVNQWYCCRNDSDANTPIELPSREPFFLYRYGGTCQEVKGMDVSNECIILDSNHEHNEYYTDANFPDGEINPLKLELCYYKPRL